MSKITVGSLFNLINLFKNIFCATQQFIILCNFHLANILAQLILNVYIKLIDIFYKSLRIQITHLTLKAQNSIFYRSWKRLKLPPINSFVKISLITFAEIILFEIFRLNVFLRLQKLIKNMLIFFNTKIIFHITHHHPNSPK